MNKYTLGDQIETLALWILLVIELKRPVFYRMPWADKIKLLPYGFVLSMPIGSINNLVKRGLFYRAEENEAYEIKEGK